MKKYLFIIPILISSLIFVALPKPAKAVIPPVSNIIKFLQPAPLLVNFTVAPSSGTVPLTVTLRAEETSSNSGPLNFYFWCNKNTNDTDIAGAEKKIENTNVEVQTFSCAYGVAGRYYPKVVVTKTDRDSIESHKSVNAMAAATPTPMGSGGEIIFEKDGKAITVKGSLVADKIVFNERQKNTQRYAARIYSDAKILYSSLLGFEILSNVLVQ